MRPEVGPGMTFHYSFLKTVLIINVYQKRNEKQTLRETAIIAAVVTFVVLLAVRLRTAIRFILALFAAAIWELRI